MALYDRVERLLAATPEAAFKLDPKPGWPADLLDRLAALDRVEILDLKGLYEDEAVGRRRLAERGRRRPVPAGRAAARDGGCRR